MKEETRIWIDSAEQDLKTVEILLQNIEAPPGIICFHCQLAAEKYLKAFLVDRDIEFQRTHDLLLLLEKYILKIDKSFAALKESAVSLTEFAISTRYPESSDSFDLGIARDAFHAMTMIRSFVLTRIKDD
jgi:HEPN domain-containing protein